MYRENCLQIDPAKQFYRIEFVPSSRSLGDNSKKGFQRELTSYLVSVIQCLIYFGEIKFYFEVYCRTKV